MALAPPTVIPEGTITSLSSCASIIPSPRRLPKAPVFINRYPFCPASFLSDPVTFVSDSEGDSFPRRTYQFDDDFASIAASESTIPVIPKRRSRSVKEERKVKPIVQESAWGHYRECEGRPSFTESLRRRISWSKDSKLLRRKAGNIEICDLHSNSERTDGCITFLIRLFFRDKPREEHRPVVQDNAEDVQMLSKLAYEEFMHSKRRSRRF